MLFLLFLKCIIWSTVVLMIKIYLCSSFICLFKHIIWNTVVIIHTVVWVQREDDKRKLSCRKEMACYPFSVLAA